MEELKRQEESRQQRILRAKEELISAEVELANLPPYETPKNELVSYTSWKFVIKSKTMNRCWIMLLNYTFQALCWYKYRYILDVLIR